VVQLLSSLGYLGVSLLRTPLLVGSVAAMTPGVVIFMGVASLVIGIAAITVGIGAWSLRTWSWPAGLITFIAAVVFGGLQMLFSGVSVFAGLVVLLAAVVIGYLFSHQVLSVLNKESGDYFTTHPSAA
jgi:hypothetical protein